MDLIEKKSVFSVNSALAASHLETEITWKITLKPIFSSNPMTGQKTTWNLIINSSPAKALFPKDLTLITGLTQRYKAMI